MTGDKPFTRIVVPIDGFLRSESAVFPAAELARRAGVPLTLFGITRSNEEREATATDLEDLVHLIGDGLVVDVIIDAVGDVIGVSCSTHQHAPARFGDRVDMVGLEGDDGPVVHAVE